jgi:hypothetical protein
VKKKEAEETLKYKTLQQKYSACGIQKQMWYQW